MPILHISFPVNDYPRLLTGQLSAAAFLAPVLRGSTDGTISAFQQILNELFEYYRYDGGSPEIHDFLIDEAEYTSPKPRLGRFGWATRLTTPTPARASKMSSTTGIVSGLLSTQIITHSA